MVLIEAPAELAAAVACDHSEDVATTANETPPETIPEHRNRGWLLMGFASIGTLVFASSFAWYAGNRTPSKPPQLLTSQSQTTESANAVPQPGVGRPEEQLPAIESHSDTSVAPEPEKEITAAEVDPFHEGERTGLFDDSVAPIVERDVVVPDTIDQEPIPAVDPLSSLAALLDNNTQLPPTIVDIHETPKLPAVETTRVSNPVGKPDIQGLLERPIPSIRFKGVPLIRFVRTISKLSGVAVSIDADSLRQASIPTNTPISVDKENLSSIEILNAALKPAGLTTVVENDVVRVVSQRTADRNLTRLSLPVGDLLQGASRDLDIASLVTSFVAPNSWQVAGGKGSAVLTADRLSVSNTKPIAVDTVVFLEKLRVARSLAPRKRIPSSLMSIDPRWKQIARRLSTRVNVDAWRETPLLDVITRIEQSASVRILMDWEALGSYQIGPSTEVTHYARNVELISAVTSLLPDNDLMIIPIDRSTIQVTTREAGQSRPYIEFYAFSALGEAGLQRIEPFILGGSAILDPGSEFAIMLGDADAHRQVISKH